MKRVYRLLKAIGTVCFAVHFFVNIPFPIFITEWRLNSVHFTFTKVKYLRTKYKVLDIEVDGGVGIPTIEAAAQVPLWYNSVVMQWPYS